MNNIYTFIEFKNLNESMIGDAFKNLFKKIMTKLDKRIADNVASFAKKIEGKKDLKEVVPLVNTFLNTSKKILEEDLGKAADLETVRKTVADTCMSIFDTMQVLSKNFNNQEILAKNILADSKYKAIFNYDKLQDFNKNVTKNVNNFIAMSAKVAGIDDKTMKALYAKPIYESKENEENEFLFEAEVDQTTTDKGAETPNNTNQQNPADANKPDEGDKKEGDNKEGATVDAEKLTKMKDTLKTVINNNILGLIFKKFKDVDKLTSGGGENSKVNKEIQDVAKLMKGSKNLDSKKNLLNTIAGVDKSGTLANIRDVVAKELNIEPDKIGKF